MRRLGLDSMLPLPQNPQMAASPKNLASQFALCDVRGSEESHGQSQPTSSHAAPLKAASHGLAFCPRPASLGFIVRDMLPVSGLLGRTPASLLISRGARSVCRCATSVGVLPNSHRQHADTLCSLAQARFWRGLYQLP